MADNYLDFSEVIPNLTAKEEAWLREQLQTVCVFGGREYPEGTVPDEFAGAEPDWTGVRFLRDNKDSDPDLDGLGFEYEFRDDEPAGWGRHLWLYTDGWGNVGNVAHLVQKFLKKFRPDECWGLTYSVTCSKPRVGEFSGGAVFVTARRVFRQNARDFVERRESAFFEKKKPTRRRKGKA